jgi:hypothetical protein
LLESSPIRNHEVATGYRASVTLETGTTPGNMQRDKRQEWDDE